MSHMSEEEINNIPDYMTGMNILQEKCLTNECINDIDDIKEILLLKYYAKNDEKEWDSKRNKMFTNYLDIVYKLKEQMIDVKNLIECCDFQVEFGELYRISEYRIKEKMEKLKDMIDKKSFPILVAGEAKAGKSTLVNLLLGCDLMPMHLTTCTRMICEIKNSKEKRATFIMDEMDSTRNRVIYLKSDAMDEITKLVKQDSETYKKAIFEYPVDFLDKFTYLVDSPGIGDTKILENIAFDFVNENAPAFIFVLNATNSCGLNLKARLLISKARDELNKEYSSFFSDDLQAKQSKYTINPMDKAVFILNHWDIIKADVECKEAIYDIKQNIIRDIKSLWDESADEGTHIFFLSALQAREWRKVGVEQTQIIQLRRSLINLITKVYERNFHNCLRTLNDILDYVEKIILRKINSNVDRKYCRLNDKSNTERLCKLLETLTRNSMERKQSIIVKLKPQIVSMVSSLTYHLKTDEFKSKILISFKKVMDRNRSTKRKKLCNVHPSRQYSVNESIEHENVDIVINILKKILERKMFKELQKWGTKTKEIENLNSLLNALFDEQINDISNEIHFEDLFIRKSFLFGDWKNVERISDDFARKEIISKVEQFFILSTITLLFPVVAMASILASPLIIKDWFKSKKSMENRQKQYDINKDEYLRNLINLSIENITEDYVREQFFTDITKKCMECINSFDSGIKLQLQEKRQLILDIERENRHFPDILHCLNVLLRRIEKCYGSYHLLRNKYLPDPCLTRRSATYLNDNETKPTVDKVISLCQSSMVYKSNKNTNVLMKMYSKEFTQQFARFQMQEADILSTGPYQCILRLKHMCFLETENKILLVLENADCNLYTYINDNQDLIPTMFTRDTLKWRRAFQFLINVSKQLCTCLEVLHNFDIRMVHPDFRIDTVLVSKTNIAETINLFICDACSNLPTQRMQQRIGGMPSEVTELCFDMGGYTLENIYRLGIIFYEMAYFNCSHRVNSQSIASMDEEERLEPIPRSIESIESDICINWSHDQHLTIPVEYNNLIKRCLSSLPQERPSAKECLDILSKIET